MEAALSTGCLTNVNMLERIDSASLEYSDDTESNMQPN